VGGGESITVKRGRREKGYTLKGSYTYDGLRGGEKAKGEGGVKGEKKGYTQPLTPF